MSICWVAFSKKPVGSTSGRGNAFKSCAAESRSRPISSCSVETIDRSEREDKLLPVYSATEPIVCTFGREGNECIEGRASSDRVGELLYEIKVVFNDDKC